MAAFPTFDSCKPIMENAAIEKAVNHLPYIGTEKPVAGCESLIIELLQSLKVIFNTLIILVIMRLTGLVNRGCTGQFPTPCKRLKTNPTRNTINLPESQWPRAEGSPEAHIPRGLRVTS